jgi:hypothetical protein
MKRVLAATATLVMMASLAGPAVAQKGMSQGSHKTPLELQYERERQDQEANEKAYNEHMKRSKSSAPAAKNDPWAGVRPANETNAKR